MSLVWCTSEKRANENVPNFVSAGVLLREAVRVKLAEGGRRKNFVGN